MTDRLKGKVAVVTGAGSSGPGVGNGKAAAILFAREGASVLCVDLLDERAQETVNIIEDEGGAASVWVADVSKQADCTAMAATAFERYGRIDVLQNNVGVASRQKLEDITEDEWDQHFRINLRSMVMAAQAVVPHMEKAGGGSIINLSSIAAVRAYPGHFNGLHGQQGGSHRANGRAGGTVGRPTDSGKRRCSGAGVHADGSRTDGARASENARLVGDHQGGGHSLGHRLGLGLPGQRRGSLDHGPDFTRRCRDIDSDTRRADSVSLRVSASPAGLLLLPTRRQSAPLRSPDPHPAQAHAR